MIGAVCLVALVALTQPASAHAILLKTAPERGATVPDAPDSVTLEFNEAVETRFGGIRVFDSRLRQVDNATFEQVSPNVVTVGVEKLPEGSYSVAWKVISADSHPVKGAFTFSVGTNSQAPNAGLDAALAQFGEVGMPVKVAGGVARFLGYATSVVMLGGILFYLRAWRPQPRGGRADVQMALATRRLLIRAWPLAALATVGLLVTQAATESASSLAGGLSPSNLRPVLDSNFGNYLMIRGLALAVLLLLILRMLTKGSTVRRSAAKLQVMTAGVVAATPAFWGHSNTLESRSIGIASDVIHALTVGAWMGGLIALLVVVPRALASVDARERAASMAVTIPRFSAIAFLSVVVLTVTGSYLAVVNIKTWQGLFDTGYGRLVLAKIVGLGIALALAGYNLFKTRKALQASADEPDESERWSLKLKKAVRGEVLVTTTILALAAALVAVSPSEGVGDSPETFVATATVGSDFASITIFPARVGNLTQVHVTMLNPDGSPDDQIVDPKVVFTQLEQNLGPFEHKGLILSPGHFVVTNVALPVPGRWSMNMVMTKGKFEGLNHTLEFNVR
ncbi:MAG: copper resistance CopC/CopD family protein [Actinomycetota bacterium]